MSNEHPERATVEMVDEEWLDEVSPWLVGRQAHAAITVLPERISGDKAVFRADMAPLVKILRADGADIVFLPTPDQTFRSEYDATAAIFLALLLNVVASAFWDGFKTLVKRIRASTAREINESDEEPVIAITLGITRNPDGSSVLWQKVSGPAEQVLDLAESIVQDYLSSGAGASPGEASKGNQPGSRPGGTSE